MARKRIEETLALKSWDEVNQALASIGENNRNIALLTVQMQEQIDTAKKMAEEAVKPYQESTKLLEIQMEAFVSAHRSELGARKTKAMTYGDVGYRKSTKVILPKGRELINRLVEQLKAKGMRECVVTKPEVVSKEALKQYTPERLTELGVKVTVKDVFGYNIDEDSIKPNP